MRARGLGRLHGADGWRGRAGICLVFAVQADGCALATVEGLAPGEGELHPIQEAFREEHGLQCGFCTPGILMTLVPFLRENPDPSEAEVRDALSGNLCRCTESCGLDAEGLPGGLQIVGRPSGEESVLALARLVQERHPLGEPPLGAGAS